MCVSCRTRVPSCRCVPVPDGACYAGGMRRKGRRVCVRLSGDASPSLWQSPSNSVGRVSAACTLTCLLRPTTSMFRARAQSIAPFFVFQTWRLFVCCMCSVFVCVAQCRALLSVSVAVWHMHHVRPDRASTFLCLSLMLVCLCVSVTCTPQEATARRMDVQGTCPSAVSFRPRRSAFGRARAAVRVGVVDRLCMRAHLSLPVHMDRDRHAARRFRPGSERSGRGRVFFSVPSVRWTILCGFLWLLFRGLFGRPYKGLSWFAIGSMGCQCRFLSRRVVVGCQLMCLASWRVAARGGACRAPA